MDRLVFSVGGRNNERLADLLGASTCRYPNVDVCAAYATWSLPLDPRESIHRGVHIELTAAHEDPVPTAATEEEAPSLVRGVLERAVERALGDAQRVAVLTGGGVDSGILLALAVEVGRRTHKEVFAVALDYAGEGDDRPYLRDLERRLGCEVVRVPPADGARHTALLDGVDGSPFYCPTGPLEAELFARAKSAGAERVLTGAGGDQLFDGRPSSLAALVRPGSLREAVRRARALRGFGSPRSPVLSWLVRPLGAGLLPRPVRARRATKPSYPLPPWAGPALRSLEARRRRLHVASLEASLPDTKPLERELFRAQRMQFALLRHQESVSTGIDRVDPYLAPEVVAMVHSIPPAWLLHGGIRRGLLRAAVRDLIPDSLRTRVDKAWVEPALVDFFRAAGGERVLLPFASGAALASLGVVDASRFRAYFDEVVRRPDTGEFWTHLWCALAVERFLRRK